MACDCLKRATRAGINSCIGARHLSSAFVTGTGSVLNATSLGPGHRWMLRAATTSLTLQRDAMTLASSGVADIAEGLGNWRIWHMLGTGDLRRRYARSRIGQFWLSLSTGLSVIILGFVWSALWNVAPGSLLPHRLCSR